MIMSVVSGREEALAIQPVAAGETAVYLDEAPPMNCNRYLNGVFDLHDFRTLADRESEVRGLRDRLLAESDWTQLPDVPLPTRDAWSAYRQALRDLPEQPGFPLEVVWPVRPGG
jgi:hypothetical protein